MKRILVSLTITAALAFAGALPAAAGGCPESGRDLGSHIAEMTPDHAITHGAEFGGMVSATAQGEEHPCP
ncbi:MAG: hypothetical protein ACRDHY_07865 [Anaerolineales bacterium]